MAEEKKSEMIIATEYEKEVVDVINFMGTLNSDEKKSFSSFIQGINFARDLSLKRSQQTV